jgi:hypothetical protein
LRFSHSGALNDRGHQNKTRCNQKDRESRRLDPSGKASNRNRNRRDGIPDAPLVNRCREEIEKTHAEKQHGSFNQKGAAPEDINWIQHHQAHQQQGAYPRVEPDSSQAIHRKQCRTEEHQADQAARLIQRITRRDVK